MEQRNTSLLTAFYLYRGFLCDSQGADFQIVLQQCSNFYTLPDVYKVDIGSLMSIFLSTDVTFISLTVFHQTSISIYYRGSSIYVQCPVNRSFL